MDQKESMYILSLYICTYIFFAFRRGDFFVSLSIDNTSFHRFCPDLQEGRGKAIADMCLYLPSPLAAAIVATIKSLGEAVAQLH